MVDRANGPAHNPAANGNGLKGNRKNVPSRVETEVELLAVDFTGHIDIECWPGTA